MTAPVAPGYQGVGWPARVELGSVLVSAAAQQEGARRSVYALGTVANGGNTAVTD